MCLAVAALVAGSSLVAPLLHAGAAGPEPAYAATDESAASWLHHDHAVCLQLQGSTARPADPPAVPLPPARASAHVVHRPSAVAGHDGRLLLRARSPPAPLLS